MGIFRLLVEETFLLAESEAKIDFLLKNKKLEDSLQRAIQNDIEIENKNVTPKELLLQWDKDDILRKNMLWIAKQYSNNVFHFGDIYKIKEDLEKFEKYKKNKNIFDSADLNKYDYNILKQKLNNIDDNNINQLGNSARRSAVEKGKDEIEKYYEDNKWFIIIPKTEAASRYWGKHTRWCTAADSKNNMFNIYNNKGPLYILINKNNPNKKYQFHFESSQFMDVDDTPIDMSMFLEDNPEIKSVFKNIIDNTLDKTNYLNWVWLDKDDLSYDQCLAAVKRDSWALEYVPEEFKTLEMCLAAIKQNGWTLRYVPKELKTPEICLAAVKQNGNSLRYVPEEFKTSEMCLAAVKQSGNALEYIPEEFKTPEICLAAVKQSGNALRYVPEEFKTSEMCLEAVKRDSWALRYVPENLKTRIQSLIA